MTDERTVELGIDGLGDAVEIGRGGFAVVYRASQPAFQRFVAVKVFGDSALGESTPADFERECQAIGRLSGRANILSVYQAGLTASGQPYLVMAYMARGSLEDRLRRDGRLPWREAVGIGVKLAKALQVAHDADVLHRDVKPENILISEDGEPLLADFGIARLMDVTRGARSRLSYSPAHVAPEVLAGDRTVAIDVYSLASTLFALIVGRPAFVNGGEDLLLILRRLQHDPVPDLLRPLQVHEAVCRVIETAMAKDPGDRPRSAAALATALEAALEADGREATTGPARERRQAAAQATKLEAPEEAAREEGANRRFEPPSGAPPSAHSNDRRPPQTPISSPAVGSYFEVVLRLRVDEQDGLEVELSPGLSSGVKSVDRDELDSIAGATVRWRRRFSNAEDVASFGAKLARALFPPEVEEALQELLESHDRLRLVIDTPDPELTAFPWEAASATFAPWGDGGHGRLTVSDVEEISVVRRPPGTILPAPDPITGAVRVRYALGPDFPANERSEALGDPSTVLAKLGAIEGFDFHATDRGTPFSAAIEGLKGCHIFHFFGHGTAEGEQTDLVFGRENQIEHIRAENVRHHFSTAAGLRMAILCACYSGTAATDSLNRAWSELGIGVVVGMQRRVSEVGASAFTVAFYTELSLSGDLDWAMVRGRRALRDTEGPFVEQATPVVYLRYQTGQVMVRVPDRVAGEAKPDQARGKDKLGSKPVVRRYPHAGNEVVLTHYLEGPLELETGYATGHLRSVTAFLGPGTLQIGSSVEQIRWDPALDAAAKADRALKGFLDTLQETRRAKRPILKLPATDDLGPISQVRVALARLAHSATQAFLRSSLEKSIPINQLEQHGVHTAGGDAFRKHLRNAIEACELAHSGDERPTLLGEQRLGSRLSELERRLENEDQGVLRGSTVEWLTSLLWHSLVCDSALYPHVEELALQVSLLHGSDRRPTRRLDPAAAVMRASLRDLGDVTARAVARGYNADEAPAAPRRRFFGALATLLHAEFDTWQGPRNPYAADRIPAPIALSANFDLELERGLASGGRPFNVAVPVYVGVVDDDIHTGDDLRWLVGRFQCRDPNPTLGQLARPVGPWRWLASCATGDHEGCDLDGPLLVKLNGSPLHQIPLYPSDPLAPADLGRADGTPRLGAPAAKGNFGDSAALRGAATGGSRRVEIEHALALGEYDFLQVTRMSQWSFDREQQNEPNDGLPFWLCAQLIRSDRYWMLLGHRFANWNTRTQVFTFLMNDSNRSRREGNLRGCAVALEFDQDRIRFLDWLGITRATGDCDELTRPIERMAQQRRSTGHA